MVLGKNARFLCILSDGSRDRISVSPLSFIHFQTREKKRKTTKVSRNEESRARERREEEEEPAGVSGKRVSSSRLNTSPRGRKNQDS